MKYAGTYDTETIKYFRPDGIIIKIVCPVCQCEMDIDLSDGVLEYPEESTVIRLDCDCETMITVPVKIDMIVNVTVSDPHASRATP